jgi:hypothetical protein
MKQRFFLLSSFYLLLHPAAFPAHKFRNVAKHNRKVFIDAIVPILRNIPVN